jgi:hypothetical protein
LKAILRSGYPALWQTDNIFITTQVLLLLLLLLPPPL